MSDEMDPTEAERMRKRRAAAKLLLVEMPARIDRSMGYTDREAAYQLFLLAGDLCPTDPQWALLSYIVYRLWRSNNGPLTESDVENALTALEVQERRAHLRPVKSEP